MGKGCIFCRAERAGLGFQSTKVLVSSLGCFRPGKSPSGHCHVLFIHAKKKKKKELPTTKMYLKSVLVVGRESVNGHQQQEKGWQLQSLLVVCDSDGIDELRSQGFQVSWMLGIQARPPRSRLKCYWPTFLERSVLCFERKSCTLWTKWNDQVHAASKLSPKPPRYEVWSACSVVRG